MCKKLLFVLATSFLFCRVPLAASQTAVQTTLIVTPADCLFHPGDDPAWSAASLDESAWRPYSQFRPDLAHPRLWIRCHLRLSGLRTVTQPEIQVRLYGSYELYLDGQRIGASGNLATGNFSLDAIRSYPVAPAQLADTTQVIALRAFDRSTLYNPGTLRGILHLPFQLRVSDAPLLNGLRASDVLAGAHRHAVTTICYSIIGILSLPLLALYAFDRSRTAVLLLALDVLSLAMLRLTEFSAATFADYSIQAALSIQACLLLAAVFTGYQFYFVLAGRRMPLFLRIMLGIATITLMPMLMDVFAVRGPGWIARAVDSVLSPVMFLALIVLASSPYVAFWPLSSVDRHMRPIAILCMLWTGADFLWFLLEITAIPSLGIPNLYARWGLSLLNARGLITTLVVVAIFVLLFREQRQIALHRASLAGEMMAAQEIQRALVPASIDTLPGLEIAVAFHPVREVGGDFYSCRVLPGNCQRILLGDVSGKGAAAAMTAAVLLGAKQQHDHDSPAALLEHLNLVMTSMSLGGFATCLCAQLTPAGTLTVANAGHLAPYRNGEEVKIDSGLPLGIAPDAAYAEAIFELAPGDSLTFLSDGVVEARNQTGELFGFDRAAAVATQSAKSIAAAAQAFGQDDDITVLTLSVAPAEMLHA